MSSGLTGCVNGMTDFCCTSRDNAFRISGIEKVFITSMKNMNCRTSRTLKVSSYKVLFKNFDKQKALLFQVGNAFISNNMKEREKEMLLP